MCNGMCEVTYMFWVLHLYAYAIHIHILLRTSTYPFIHVHVYTRSGSVQWPSSSWKCSYYHKPRKNQWVIHTCDDEEKLKYPVLFLPVTAGFWGSQELWRSSLPRYCKISWSSNLHRIDLVRTHTVFHYPSSEVWPTDMLLPLGYSTIGAYWANIYVQYVYMYMCNGDLLIIGEWRWRAKPKSILSYCMQFGEDTCLQTQH